MFCLTWLNFDLKFISYPFYDLMLKVRYLTLFNNVMYNYVLHVNNCGRSVTTLLLKWKVVLTINI